MAINTAVLLPYEFLLEQNSAELLSLLFPVLLPYEFLLEQNSYESTRVTL